VLAVVRKLAELHSEATALNNYVERYHTSSNFFSRREYIDKAPSL
jgi:hypothetical protein